MTTVLNDDPRSRTADPDQDAEDGTDTTAAPPVVPSKPLYARQRLPRYVLHLLYLASSRIAPGLGQRVQKLLIRGGYWLLSAFDRPGEGTTFMNFGYAPLTPGDPATAAQADTSAEGFGSRLYFRVAVAAELAGKDVLEVGSGRGGGSAFMMSRFQPRSLTGVDFSASAVRFCRQRYQMSGLTFVEGDAESLPLPANAFDVVVNVESSHCYPSFDRFLQEVVRVLRPGGCFLFADLRLRHQIPAMRQRLLDAGLVVVEEADITPNIVRALELDTERRRTIIRQRVPRLFQRGLANLMSVKGTPTFEALAARELEYWRFVCRKPAGGERGTS